VAIAVFAPSAATSGAAKATVWVAPGGADGSCAAGVRARPCATVNRAYQLARPGDTVSVQAGSYPGQTIEPSRSGGKPGAANVVIAGGAGVTITGTLAVYASHVTVSGFTDTASTGLAVGAGGGCAAFPCSFPTTHVTVMNFHVQSMTVIGDTILVKNGVVGPHDVCSQGGTEDGIVVGGLGSGLGPNWTPSNHVTIDHVTIHDIRNSGCGNHVDGIQLYSWHNFTLRDSRIYNTDSSLVLGYSFDEQEPAQTDRILIENNFFGSVPHLGHGITLGAASGSPSYTCGSEHEIIQNNTFYGNAGADIACGTHPAAVFRNNIVLSRYACTGPIMEWTWSYNVFANPGPGCAGTPHAKVCTPRFADPAHTNGNADLARNDVCAVNAVKSGKGTFPATDIHGTKRPQGTAVDAGADEIRLKTP
jgi:hypothetical protein